MTMGAGERELLFTVGPVEMDDATRAIGGDPLPYFRTAEFSEVVHRCQALLKQAVGAGPADHVALLACSGTGAMEAAVTAIFTPADHVLCIDGGSFGARFRKICDVNGIPCTPIVVPPGEPFRFDQLAGLDVSAFTGLLVNMHETSTGQLYDMVKIGDFCRANGLALVVDAISSFLADPYAMGDVGAAATIVSSHKGLALAPGLSAVVLGDRTYRDRVLANPPRSVYFDLASYVEDGQRGQTPFTPAVGIVYQLHDKLERLCEAGVPAAVARTASLAGDFRARLGALPVELPDYPLSNALTPVQVRDAYELYLRLRRSHGICVNPSGGALGATTLRVGHLGNLTTKDNESLIAALEEEMSACKLS